MRLIGDFVKDSKVSVRKWINSGKLKYSIMTLSSYCIICLKFPRSRSCFSFWKIVVGNHVLVNLIIVIAFNIDTNKNSALFILNVYNFYCQYSSLQLRKTKKTTVTAKKYNVIFSWALVQSKNNYIRWKAYVRRNDREQINLLTWEEN